MADLHIVKTELHDADVMDALLNDSGFSKKDRDRLSRYKQGRKHGNQHEVVYHYAKGCEVNQLGRLYPHDNQGLQAFPFDMRNPLLEKYYWDVDMENCHYIILAKLADVIGLPNEAIYHYINNRDEALAAVSSTRRIAKTAFLKIAYGGTVKLYNEYYDDDGIAEGDLTLVRRIEREMTGIVDRVWSDNKAFHRLVKNKKNPKYSLFALILQTEERKCLLAMDAYFKSKGRSVDILIHDGCEVRKLEGETCLHPELLQGAEQAILEATGYAHRLCVKPFKHSFVMPERKTSSVLINDDYAAKTLVELLGTHICKSGDKVYYFNTENGMWEQGETPFRAAVHKHKLALVFREMTETKCKIHDYSGVDKKVSALRAFIKNHCLERDLFCEESLKNTYYKLLFKNGIFDFRSGFTEGFDESLVFLRRIDRDFSAVRDADKEALVLNTLFVDPFKDSSVGIYLLKSLIVAMTGDYSRKKFYFGIGKTNCGKGVLTGALQNTFGGYIDLWNADELLYNPRASADRAKRLAWVKDLGGRIGFSNEIRMERSQIDMNLVKAIASGGDGMLARKNFQDQEVSINRTTLFLLANDIPEFAPKDSATEDRAVIIPYGYSFTNNEVLKPGQKKANPLVKNMFLDDDYRTALFWLFADGFDEMVEAEKSWGGKIEAPGLVRAETKEYSGDGSLDFNEAFNEAFEVTNDPEDKVLSSAVLRHLVEVKRLRHSPQMIGKLIKELIELPDGEDPKALIGKARLAGWKGVRER